MTVDLHHVVEGPARGPAVVLAPSLGTTLAMWDHLATALRDSFRVVRFDVRGHGRSPDPGGSWTVRDLADDVVSLADRLDLGTFAVVGLSLGGAIGQVLASDHADRVSSLVLCCTSARFGDPAAWRERARRVRADGMAWLAEPTHGRWFPADFREGNPEAVTLLIAMLTGTPPRGYAACCDALAAFDGTDRLGAITAPTRVIAGTADPVSGPDSAGILVQGIPMADLVLIEGAAHLANATCPEQFATAVLDHLEGKP